MAISFISASTGNNTNSIASMPSHQAGDLLIIFACRDGNNTAPSLPAGWTNVLNTAGTSTIGARTGYKIAASGAETSGTWTNATSVVCVVYRGADIEEGPIGGSGVTSSTGTSVTYPTLTMLEGGGTSWVAGFAGHRSVNTSLETPPSGMSLREDNIDATDEAVSHDTNGGVSSWSNTAVSVGGTSSGWISHTVEIVAAPTSGAVFKQLLSFQTGQSGFGAGAHTTASFTPTNGRRLVVIVGSHDPSFGAGISASLTVAGSSGQTPTFTPIGNINVSGGGNQPAMRAWISDAVTHTATTLDFDCGAVSVDYYKYAIFEVTATGSVDGLVTNAASPTDGATTPTLGATPTAGDLVFYARMLRGGDGSMSMGTGWRVTTSLLPTGGSDGGSFGVAVSRALTGTSVSVLDTNLTPGNLYASVDMAFIVRQPSGGGGFNPGWAANATKTIGGSF